MVSWSPRLVAVLFPVTKASDFQDFLHLLRTFEDRFQTISTYIDRTIYEHIMNIIDELINKLLNTPEIERPTSHRTANSQASIALQNRQL